jgi:hypothetical protein
LCVIVGRLFSFREESRADFYFWAFLLFCFVHPAQVLLNATSQLLARDRRAVAQSAELGPGDLRMDTAVRAAVGAGDDVFSWPTISGERDEAIGYQFRMLDELGGVADNTRNQDLPGGEFHVAPDLEFMFVGQPVGLGSQVLILAIFFTSVSSTNPQNPVDDWL